MPVGKIKFGTDGWRGIIADDFTFANLRLVAQGVADYLKSKGPEPLAVIGYDLWMRRFGGAPSALGRTVGFYPGPAGATESELDLGAWDEIRAAEPRVDLVAADTEALIVRVPEDENGSPECHLVPIDACYEFVGRMRMMWRGFDGGQEVRQFIDDFFDHVRTRSKVVAG